MAAQQQQFAARLQSAGSGAADAATQQAQQAVQQETQQAQQGQQPEQKAGAGWGEGSIEAASDPPSLSLASLAGHSLGGSGQLAHAESAGFSSWGLPSPSTGEWLAAVCLVHCAVPCRCSMLPASATGLRHMLAYRRPSASVPSTVAATARTPFDGLSRFNSLAGSSQYSPQAGHRPALPFAFAGQQQQVPQQLGSGSTHAPWAGIPPFAAAQLAGGAAAGGSGHSSARGDEEACQAGPISDVPLGPELISRTAMGILGGLGISVSAGLGFRCVQGCCIQARLLSIMAAACMHVVEGELLCLPAVPAILRLHPDDF